MHYLTYTCQVLQENLCIFNLFLPPVVFALKMDLVCVCFVSILPWEQITIYRKWRDLMKKVLMLHPIVLNVQFFSLLKTNEQNYSPWCTIAQNWDLVRSFCLPSPSFFLLFIFYSGIGVETRGRRWEPRDQGSNPSCASYYLRDPAWFDLPKLQFAQLWTRNNNSCLTWLQGGFEH